MGNSNDFWHIAANSNLWLVACGGLIGGLLQPIVARLIPNAQNPPGQAYLFSPLLGIAAAGISVYVVTPTDTSQVMRLLFFSLLCGLAFPAVLAQAIDTVGQKTANVQKKMTQIANQAETDDVGDTAQAAQQLRVTLAQNPLDSLKLDGQAAVETEANRAVGNIADTPLKTADDQRQIIEELQDVGTVAKTAGWRGTAQATISALTKLGASVKDNQVQLAATRAVHRINVL
jgi:hypothetical protein